MVNWDAPDIEEWKEEARATQQQFCDLLGDRVWDVIDSDDWEILWRKVGFGMFGPPSCTPRSSNSHTGYDGNEFRQIDQVCNQLVEGLNFDNRQIHFACVFVVGKIYDNRFTIPVFKAKRRRHDSSSCIYVDTKARRYSSWSDYLNNNKLPKCIYCYPTNGIYEYRRNGTVAVKFGTSPACDFVNRLFSAFDVVATVVQFTVTAIGVAALFAVPIAGPIAVASAAAATGAGVYGAGRSTYNLYDRAGHGQSIALNDTEARECWLAIVTSSLGFANGRMIAYVGNVARSGQVMTKAGHIAFVVLQTGNLSVKGIAIVHGFAVLVDKTERNELTPLELYQYTASVLFFTNAVLTPKTANAIIKEVQRDVINTHSQGLSRDSRRLFNEYVARERRRGPEEIHGNARIVQQLNRIENTQDFYEIMVNDRNSDDDE